MRAERSPRLARRLGPLVLVLAGAVSSLTACSDSASGTPGRLDRDAAGSAAAPDATGGAGPDAVQASDTMTPVAPDGALDTASEAVGCGDGLLQSPEACDDGDTEPGDGCDASCAIEEGFTCPTPGAPCVADPACGDGAIDAALGEGCDDGNADSGDGCSEQCVRELDWLCPVAGSPCVYLIVCGDGQLGGAETCDDGDSASEDGCSEDCALEPGWECPTPGLPCSARACGDGLTAGSEGCDDGDTDGGDGCSATCALEPGFACVGATCHPTVCGDGVVEGNEQCDDGALRPYDGCSPTCEREVECPAGVCAALCGDGLIFSGEDCDDGNTSSGDGCSATCAREAGFDCETITELPPASLAVPILYHDQLPVGAVVTVDGVELRGNPDFDIARFSVGVVTGMVAQQLGADHTPAWVQGGFVQSADSFHGWFHDDPTSNRPVWLDAAGRPTRLLMTGGGSPDRPTYQFQSTGNAFFPIDGLGLDPYYDHGRHNYNFTSEVHVPFTYRGGESLTFSGDDDVWVFIGGQLAVDLGGLHGLQTRSVTLDPTVATRLGLVVGRVYQISVFHAERHATGSNYALTLGGFARVRSRCESLGCGDGVTVAGEACDDGPENGAGYGHCAASCTLGPRCGDGVVQADHEVCDAGPDAVTYGGASADACAPGCSYAPFCGDGLVSDGESCDKGAANGQAGSYCSPTCRVVKP